MVTAPGWRRTVIGQKNSPAIEERGRGIIYKGVTMRWRERERRTKRGVKRMVTGREKDDQHLALADGLTHTE